MKLVVNELREEGVAQIVTPPRHVLVEAIRPHIYRHGFPSGTLKLQILNGGGEVVAESNDVPINSIGTLSYFHGYIRFDITAYLAKNESYVINLVGDDDYAFDESAFCGWVNGLDLGKYAANEIIATSWNAPLDLEIWERTVK